MTAPTLAFLDGAGDVVADLDRLMEFGVFVEGASRSGKTNLVRVFLEQTYGLVQHIVVDVEGEYVTLRSKDRPYLIVGRGRDVELPADPESRVDALVASGVASDKARAQALRELADAVERFTLAIVEKGVSVIFDLSEYDIDEQQPIVAAVCDALVSLPESHAGAAAVVLEELQDFAPEGGGKGSAIASVRRLSKRGLKRGFFIVGASQRVSDVSKGVVTQLKTKMIGGTDLKDAPRALEELGLPSKEKGAVTDLPQGDFWVKGPAFERHAQLVRPPRSITAPPKRKRGEPPAPAAEAPAEIAALARALAAAAAPVVASPTPSGDVKKGEILPFTYSNNDMQRARDEARYDEAQRHERYRNVLRAECDHAIEQLRTLRGDVNLLVETFAAVVAGIDEQWVKPVAPDPVTPPSAQNAIIELYHNLDVRSPASSVAAALVLPDPMPGPALPKAQQAILDAIGFYASIGNRTPAKAAVGSLAGVNPNLSTWRNHMAALRAAYLVRDVGKNQLELTATGSLLVRRVDVPSLRELHERWLSELGTTPAAILRALIAVYPAPMTKQQLGARVGVDSSLSTWRNHMAPLRKLGLVDDIKGGELRASTLLFPEGLK